MAEPAVGGAARHVAAGTERLLGAGVRSVRPVAGGDVARAFAVTLADGRRVFAKTHPGGPPGCFVTEPAGLSWLAEAAAVRVPEVLGVREEPPGLLVLAWIDEGPPRPGTDAELGRELAALHAAGAPCFGRTDRRTTGSRGLPNEPCPTWREFYATQRLWPLARLARDADALDPAVIADLERLADGLDAFAGAEEPPARLHGDLWAGNRLVDRQGHSWLIDPAAHGGHREFDLAMMRLFGGFGPECFAAYERCRPLPDGWELRVPLHQVAPLVVHAIKFGGGYRAAAARAITAALAAAGIR